nr:PREDICTED: uncharacterized protein LOC104248543 isoform X3 [Nicotiana sylvestris]
MGIYSSFYMFSLSQNQEIRKRLSFYDSKVFNWLSPSMTSAKKFSMVMLQTKTEIVVTQGDQDGGKIAEMVREIGASTLVAGLHDQSFLYRLAMTHNHIARNLNCKVLAIKQPTPSPMATRTRTIYFQDSSTNMDFSQIEIDALSVPEVNPPKIPYQVCPDPHSIIWRSGRSRRWETRH